MSNRVSTIKIAIITFATVFLGVAAVAISLRLQQVATQPVAPNVPQSEPQAAVAPIAINGCFGSFDIGSRICFESCTRTEDCASGGGITLQCQNSICVNPVCPTEPSCVCQPTPTPSPIPTSTPVPTLTPTTKPTSTPAPTATPVPLCNSVCTTTSQCPTDLICSNGYCRNEVCVNESDCTCQPTPTPTLVPSATPTSTPLPTATLTPKPTATPTVAVTCNGSCVSTAQCSGGLVCSEGFCRNETCTQEPTCVCVSGTPTPTPTPAPGCNGTCTANSQCPNDMICHSETGRCRNPNCTWSEQCVCSATPTPTPTSGPTATPLPQLPVAGTTIPSFGLLMMGLLIILIGVGMFVLI